MTSPYCAICRRHVALDDDHVEIDGEVVRTADRNDIDTYLAHTDCWRSVSEGWMQPA